MKQRKWLLALAGILISLIFLSIAFRNLNPGQVWASIQQAAWPLLLVAAVWYFAAVTVIALRWEFLLNAVKRIPLPRLIPLVCIGYAGNNIYPFRAGELLRVLLLHGQHGIAVGRGMTTVVVERVFDGLVMLSFIVLPLALGDVSSPEVRQVAMVAAPIFLIAMFIFLLLAAQPDLLRKLVQFMARWLPEALREPIVALAEDVITGLAGLRTPGNLLGAVLCSYLTWALEASVYWLVSRAFNLDTHYLTMLLVVGVVNLAGLIPASPGQFGVFEAFASAVLVGAGVPELQSVAFALTVHMLIWLPVTLAGLFFLLQQGLGLGAIAKARRLEKQAIG